MLAHVTALKMPINDKNAGCPRGEPSQAQCCAISRFLPNWQLWDVLAALPVAKPSLLLEEMRVGMEKRKEKDTGRVSV